MKIDSTIRLYGGGDSWLVHPPGLITDTPAVRDIARRRLVKTNPDIDASALSQTDSAGFIGKKYRTQDTKYGHYVNEHDSSASAQKAALTRPYTRVLKHTEPGQTQKGRNKSRKKAIQTNPDNPDKET